MDGLEKPVPQRGKDLADVHVNDMLIERRLSVSEEPAHACNEEGLSHEAGTLPYITVVR